MNSGAALPCIDGEAFSGGGAGFCKNCDARDAENPSGRTPAMPRICPNHARLEIFWMVTGGSVRNEATVRPAMSGLATPDHTFVTQPEQNFLLSRRRPEPRTPFSGGQQRKPTLIRNLFEREATRARPENSDRDDDHEHSEGDKSKNSCSSKTLEEESNDKAGKCGR